MKQLGLKAKILLAGTSEEYGDGENNEYSLPRPRSPYAVSKLAMTNLGLLYAGSYGMDIVITRAFNHTGPGRGEMYAESSFAKQIVEIERGKRAYLNHGNLESVRNFTDVRDMVRAYSLAIDLPSDIYNICSDQNVAMEEVLGTLVSLSGSRINGIEDKSLYRPSDFSFVEPNCEKFYKLTKWQPKIDLKTTLKDILEHWRVAI